MSKQKRTLNSEEWQCMTAIAQLKFDIERYAQIQKTHREIIRGKHDTREYFVWMLDAGRFRSVAFRKDYISVATIVIEILRQYVYPKSNKRKVLSENFSLEDLKTREGFGVVIDLIKKKGISHLVPSVFQIPQRWDVELDYDNINATPVGKIISKSNGNHSTFDEAKNDLIDRVERLIRQRQRIFDRADSNAKETLKQIKEFSLEPNNYPSQVAFSRK